MDLLDLSEADLIRRLAECDERATAYRGELARRQAVRVERRASLTAAADTLGGPVVALATWLIAHWPKS